MRKVLVIDDVADIREVISLSLEASGWQVTAVSSGAEGIAIAQSYMPDAIVLDVQMPDMDGPATFRELQKIDRVAHIPVILLTAKVQAIDRRRFAELSIAGVLLKPFNPMKLSGEISQLLGWD